MRHGALTQSSAPVPSVRTLQRSRSANRLRETSCTQGPKAYRLRCSVGDTHVLYLHGTPGLDSDLLLTRVVKVVSETTALLHHGHLASCNLLCAEAPCVFDVSLNAVLASCTDVVPAFQSRHDDYTVLTDYPSAAGRYTLPELRRAL